MMHLHGERIVEAHMIAIKMLLDPRRPVFDAASPIAVTASYGLDMETLRSLTGQASRTGASVVHAEFEEGAEIEGPRNIVAAIVRDGLGHPKSQCTLWMGKDGRVLLAAGGDNPGRVIVSPDGMKFLPGIVSGAPRPGFARAAATLRRIVDRLLELPLAA